MFSVSRAYVPTHNQRLILDLVRTRGPVSRADIVRLSGLTFPSVSRIVGELIDRDLVAETRQRRGGMGKPPTDLELNPKSAFSVGLNFDYDHLSAVLVDLSGEILARDHVALTDSGPDTVLPLMYAAVETLLQELARKKVSRQLLLGIGVSLPLPLCADRVTGNLPERLSAWQDVSLASALGGRFGCPLFLENDATAAAIGERWYGAGRNVQDFLLVFFASGVGGGVVLGGRPHVGHRGFGGEFGCTPETSGIQTRAAPSSLLRLLAEAGAGEALSAAELEVLYEEENEIVLGWLGSAADALAPVLVSAEYLLDPEAFIFGGRLPAKLTDALITRLRERLASSSNPVKPHQPELLRGKTGDDAAAFGAAAVPIYRAMTPDPTPDGSYRSALAQEPVY